MQRGVLTTGRQGSPSLSLDGPLSLSLILLLFLPQPFGVPLPLPTPPQPHPPAHTVLVELVAGGACTQQRSSRALVSLGQKVHAWLPGPWTSLESGAP